MESSLHELLDSIDIYIRYYNIIQMICQSLLYGIFLCLFPITVHAMVTNGLQSRARKWLLVTVTFSFAVINAYWIFSVVLTLLSTDSLNNILTACYGSQNAVACIDGELTAAFQHSAWDRPRSLHDIALVNFIIADGVVVWRAWVLCSDQSRIVLMIPVIMLAINTVIYLVIVAMTAILVITNDLQLYVHLFDIVDIAEVTQLTLSLIINVYATSIIGLKAWKYRKLLLESRIAPGQAIKILALLVESGVVYILIGVTSLVSLAILKHFQHSEIISLIFLAGTHLAGIYTIVVVLLVEKNRSLDTTYRSLGTITDVRRNQPPQVEHMIFAPKLALASGGKINFSDEAIRSSEK